MFIIKQLFTVSKQFHYHDKIRNRSRFIFYTLSNLSLHTTKFRKKENYPLGTAVNLAFKKYPTTNTTSATIPIIIMHGILGSKTNWGSIAKMMSKSTTRQIITIDARNHGDSPHTDEFSYSIMVSDLLKFMYDQKISKSSFISHSMGGRLCMLFALMYPEKVQSLVVVDISPLGQSPDVHDLPPLLELISSLKIQPELNPQEARRHAFIQLKEKVKDQELVHFLVANITEGTNSFKWRWKFNLKSILKYYETHISQYSLPDAKFKNPTLFVGGEQSNFLRRDEEQEIRRFFPSAEFIYVNGAGHLVHVQKPQEFLTIVTEFFNKDMILLR